MKTRRKFLQFVRAAATAPVFSRIARAQAYPSRPITIIIPFAAGGPTDVVGRLLAERMRGGLGQSVLVENSAGAGGTIGVGRVARAAPDGYTLSFGITSTHVFNGAMYSLQYDLIKDFEPVALIARDLGTVIVARKTTPANDLRELIGWLKTGQERASFGTAGVGSQTHITGVVFQNLAGTPLQFVHYRGVAPALQDLVSGQIDISIVSSITSLPLARAGSIRAYAITATRRLAVAPDIPTVDEAGLPGMYVPAWYGLWAPKATPGDVIAKLNLTVRTAFADPAMRSRLTDLALEIVPREQQTSEALGALQKAEIEKWWPIIKAANIRGE
jgi:tripartite-type tricarboxylate transporter receptor subunit TctC